MKDINNIDTFKEKLQKNIIPCYYYIGDRSQILHKRLRLRYSNLNRDKADIGLVEDGSCGCGLESKSVEHYLLYYPLYVDERLKMLQKIAFLEHVSPNMLLHGTLSVDTKTNIQIFKAVQRYIAETKRFELKI